MIFWSGRLPLNIVLWVAGRLPATQRRKVAEWKNKSIFSWFQKGVFGNLSYTKCELSYFWAMHAFKVISQPSLSSKSKTRYFEKRQAAGRLAVCSKNENSKKANIDYKMHLQLYFSFQFTFLAIFMRKIQFLTFMIRFLWHIWW